MDRSPELPKDTMIEVARSEEDGSLEIAIPTLKADYRRKALLALVLGGLVVGYFHEDLLAFMTSNATNQDGSLNSLGFWSSVVIGMVILIAMKRAREISRLFTKSFTARDYGLKLRILGDRIEIGSDEPNQTFEAQRVSLDKVRDVAVDAWRDGDFVYGNRTDHLVRLRQDRRDLCIAMPSLAEARWLEAILKERLGA